MRGVYILVIIVDEGVKIGVGALGKILFERGTYIYVGSAQDSLERRIERHLRRSKRLFWHIDYLLCNSFVKISRIFHKRADRSEECRLAKRLKDATLPVVGFGSSDCKCVSHLFLLKDPTPLKLLSENGFVNHQKGS